MMNRKLPRSDLMSRYLWGVDSAASVKENLYNCVINNFGKPMFWGRYLTTIQNVNEGLTPTEIRFLHQKGVKVMPIYNDFREAVGYRQGQVVARNAIFNAQRLGFPKGTFIFANIEKFFKVDEAWIRGYVDTFYPSNYRPGIYNDPQEGDFSKAFCEAAKKHERVRVQTVLWSAQPEPGVTAQKDAPTFNPAKPPCVGNVWAWQYGRDAKACPIDTNLLDQRIYDNLW